MGEKAGTAGMRQRRISEQKGGSGKVQPDHA
jgi:hypothetical protein